MRPIVYPFLLLLLTACATASPQQALLEKAQRGDAAAQLALGDSLCDTRPGVYKSDTAQPVSWWKKAAESKDRNISRQANERLGTFYFGRYVDASHYKPGETKPIALCRGDTPAAPDFDNAIAHFKKCADGGGESGMVICETQLGWVYDAKQDYAQAYFWYATVMAYILASNADEDEWGLPVMKKFTLADPRLKDVPERAFAAKAAKHLSAKKIAEINERAQTYMLINGPRWLMPEDRLYDTAHKK